MSIEMLRRMIKFLESLEKIDLQHGRIYFSVKDSLDICGIYWQEIREFLQKIWLIDDGCLVENPQLIKDAVAVFRNDLMLAERQAAIAEKVARTQVIYNKASVFTSCLAILLSILAIVMPLLL